MERTEGRVRVLVREIREDGPHTLVSTRPVDQDHPAIPRPRLVKGHGGETYFLSSLGEKITIHHMTKIFRDYIIKADIGKFGSCHPWRHSAATALLEARMDLRHLAAFLGHANLNTVAGLYTQVGIKALKDLHQAMRPATTVAGRADGHANVEQDAETAEALMETLDHEGEDAE